MTERILIENARLVLKSGVEEGTVRTEQGRIAEILTAGERPGGAWDEKFDARGGYLTPGFIDLHVHGFHEHQLDRGPVDLAAVCRLLPRHGVTGFLPTLCPRPRGEDLELIRRLAAAKTTGAAVLAFHLEGPFLVFPGALPADAIGKADPARVVSLIEAARPYPMAFSASPDFEGVKPLIRLMRQRGATVFLTHTAADVDQTRRAIEAGARHATHFYDVFYPPAETDKGVRPCGAVEAILADSRTTVDFILDGVHVDPVAVEVALKCLGRDRVCLITDGNVGTGLGKGRFHFGSQEVEFLSAGGPARLTEHSTAPGGLAGSGLTMDQALRNAVGMLKLDLPTAAQMVSANPAHVMGLDRTKGRLAVGCDADLTLLDDALNVVRTWVGGECEFPKP